MSEVATVVSKEEESDKAVARELAKLTRDDQKEAAGEIVKQHRQFAALLPKEAVEHIQYYILSAVKYVRRHIDDPFTPHSFVDAVFDGARYGLAIDGRLAHALPFADKEKDGTKNLVFVPDYKGMVYVSKHRKITKDVRSYVVCENDDFLPPGEAHDGPLTWSFRPCVKDRGKPIGALCVLEFMDGVKTVEWMQQVDISKIRSSARYDKIWNAWPDEMAKKSVIRRAFKLHQDDPVLAALLADDDASYDDDVIELTPRTRALELPETAAIGSDKVNVQTVNIADPGEVAVAVGVPRDAGGRPVQAVEIKPKRKRGRPSKAELAKRAAAAESPAKPSQERAAVRAEMAGIRAVAAEHQSSIEAEKAAEAPQAAAQAPAAEPVAEKPSATEAPQEAKPGVKDSALAKDLAERMTQLPPADAPEVDDLAFDDPYARTGSAVAQAAEELPTFERGEPGDYNAAHGSHSAGPAESTLPPPAPTEPPEGDSGTGESQYQELVGYAESHNVLPDGWTYDDEAKMTAADIVDRCKALKESLEKC